MFVNIHYFNVALLVGFLLYLSAFFYNHYTFDNDITPEIYQKNQGYLTCHSTLTNWNNWCDTKSAGVISSEIVIGNVFEETNDRWGNKLSVYWQVIVVNYYLCLFVR